MTTHELLALVLQKRRQVFGGGLSSTQALADIQSHDPLATEIVDGLSHEMLQEMINANIDILQNHMNGIFPPRDDV